MCVLCVFLCVTCDCDANCTRVEPRAHSCVLRYPQIIQCLDMCVEIPQFGVIRSLNVHVSASMLLWEYTRQRLTRAGPSP